MAAAAAAAASTAVCGAECQALPCDAVPPAAPPFPCVCAVLPLAGALPFACRKGLALSLACSSGGTREEAHAGSEGKRGPDWPACFCRGLITLPRLLHSKKLCSIDSVSHSNPVGPFFYGLLLILMLLLLLPARPLLIPSALLLPLALLLLAPTTLSVVLLSLLRKSLFLCYTMLVTCRSVRDTSNRLPTNRATVGRHWP